MAAAAAGSFSRLFVPPLLSDDRKPPTAAAPSSLENRPLMPRVARSDDWVPIWNVAPPVVSTLNVLVVPAADPLKASVMLKLRLRPLPLKLTFRPSVPVDWPLIEMAASTP